MTCASSAWTRTRTKTRTSRSSWSSVARTSFSGREIASVLRSHGFRPAGRTGSHLKLRYEHPETDEVRIVSVPMVPADDLPTGTLQSIAEQSGAEDFHAWCEWIDGNR